MHRAPGIKRIFLQCMDEKGKYVKIMNDRKRFFAGARMYFVI